MTKGNTSVVCPAGTFLLGGGGRTFTAGPAVTALVESRPLSNTTWTVTGVKAAATVGSALIVQAYAVCTT
jgi:hypothetical protein